MDHDLNQASVRLAKASLLKLSNAGGSRVAVLWGAVWLTQEEDSRDFELHAGESMVIGSNGLTLITASADAAIWLLEPTSESDAARRLREQDANAPAGVRYVSAAEMDRYERRARQLRAQYLASVGTRAAQVLHRAFGWVRGRLARRCESGRSSWLPAARFGQQKFQAAARDIPTVPAPPADTDRTERSSARWRASPNSPP